MKAFLLGCLLAIASGLAAAQGGSGDAQTGEAPGAAARQVLVLLQVPPAHFRPDGNYSGGYADAPGNAARRRLARGLAHANGLRLVTDWPMPLLGLECYVMQVPDDRAADAVAMELQRDGRVTWAQPMNLFRSLGQTSGGLADLQPAMREWRLDALHANATGRDVRVAVIDSGIQLDHPDLAGQIAVSANLLIGRPHVAESHGTAVAGIIAARGAERGGTAGVAPEARLLALRACWQHTRADTLCTTLGLALGLHAAIDNRARVINLSLGGPPDRLVRSLVEAALARDISVVAAVDGSAPGGGFPAAVPGVVAVGDETSVAKAGGAFGAPGTDIPAPAPDSRWATVSGTSYAAAHVSGLLALMLDSQARARRSPRPIATDLVRQADGRIDACASLGRAGDICICDCGSGPVAAPSVGP